MNIKVTDKQLLDCLYNMLALTATIDTCGNPEGHNTNDLARLKKQCQIYLERPLIKALNENI